MVPMSERKGKARAKQERLEGEVAVNYDANLLKWCRRPGSNRYGPCGPWDFKSQASAYSATPALVEALLVIG